MKLEGLNRGKGWAGYRNTYNTMAEFMPRFMARAKVRLLTAWHGEWPER
jgi:hypothetical protein